MGRKKILIDKGERNLLATLRDISKRTANEAEVGFIPGLASEESIQAAAINEVGTSDGHVPARPFLTYAADDFPAIIRAAKKQVFKAGSRGSGANRQRVDVRTKVNDWIALAAHMCAEHTRSMILDDGSPAKNPRNAVSTIKQKGFDDPLVESGEMSNDVWFRVKRRSGGAFRVGRADGSK